MFRRALAENRAPSFIQALVVNVVGLVATLGFALLVAIVWQGVESAEQASRREIDEILDRAAERLRILVRAAEMTLESAERAARSPPVTSTSLRAVLESSLAAFEQRPELSFLGIVLPETGEYGNLERTATGDILLWLLPGKRPTDPIARNYLLTNAGFVPHEEHPTDGYDARLRPFYRAALGSVSGDTWMPSYQWIVHFVESEPLWGISYVKALRNAAGSVIAVLDTDLDLPALNAFLASLARDYHTQFQIVELGANPRVIGDSTVGREPKPLSAALTPLLRTAGDVFVGRMEMDGEPRWVGARRLSLSGGVSWLVIASRQAPYIEAPLRRLLYQMVGMGILITIGLTWVSMRLAQRFGRPLVELEKRVAGIGLCESGALAANAPSAADAYRETQLLGEALDKMAVSVSQVLDAKEQKAASLALKGAIFDTSNTAIFSVDQQLQVVEWNAAAERLFGVGREQSIGRRIEALVVTPAGELDWSAVKALPGMAAFRFKGAQDDFDAELRVAAFKRNGQDVYTFFINDVSERKRADAALQESLARFHAAALVTRDVVWDWNIAANSIWWNENFQTLFGYAADDIQPRIEFWANRIHPEDKERVLEQIHAYLGGLGEVWTDEYRLRRKDGSYADVLDRGRLLRDESGRGIRMVGAMQDITDRKQAEQRIQYLATHDGLTGLPNRHLIQDRIEQAISHARRTQGLLALLYLDLDRFKVINDGYGHAFGDTVLQAAADRLRRLVRDGDTVARLSGDEFLILLTDLRAVGDAHSVAQKIVEQLNAPVIVQDRKVQLSGSVGVSVFPQDAETADVLIANADMAMYRAKDLGRNTCQFFTVEMSEKTQQRVDLENQLRWAIATDQLRLVYQPKVSLTTGRISGCEALLRWHHPNLGTVSPAQFIPVAEDSGLIVPIGDWALREACRQAQAWVDAGLPPTRVGVNVSARQFLQQDVGSWVERTLEETGLSPALLELELTESLLARDVDKVTRIFAQLRSTGVKLSIDDFGTGYSSLSYLKRFRVDTLKIDQSFVRDMLMDSEDAAIVMAVIALAHNLDFKVIAEGVETEEHCRVLQASGCDEMQGFYFSKPVVAAEFEDMLRMDKRLS